MRTEMRTDDARQAQTGFKVRHVLAFSLTLAVGAMAVLLAVFA